MKEISNSTLRRLPIYLGYLKSLPSDEQKGNISAPVIAAALNMGDVQVRKDLASVSSGGKPKTGYKVTSLIQDLEEFLGYNNIHDAVIIGAGKLGRALLEYIGFSGYGLNIVAAFDADEKMTGFTEHGKPVFSLKDFDEYCRQHRIKIGIITVPSEAAQSVCDKMIQNGILAVWNFAPTHLDVPNHILVQNENMAASLALLSNHLKNYLEKQ